MVTCDSYAELLRSHLPGLHGSQTAPSSLRLYSISADDMVVAPTSDNGNGAGMQGINHIASNEGRSEQFPAPLLEHLLCPAVIPLSMQKCLWTLHLDGTSDGFDALRRSLFGTQPH